MTGPTADPRTGVTLPADIDITEAAALVSVWLRDNVGTVKDCARFVVELDDLMADYDFTIACVKGLAPGLPDSGH
jgi:hypothetical protein